MLYSAQESFHHLLIIFTGELATKRGTEMLVAANYRYPEACVMSGGSCGLRVQRKVAPYHASALRGEDNLCLLIEGGSAQLLST